MKLPKVVIDTNVVVSSIISPNGNPFTVMEMVSDGELALFYSTEIINEYKRVLAYREFYHDTK